MFLEKNKEEIYQHDAWCIEKPITTTGIIFVFSANFIWNIFTLKLKK